MNEKTICFKCSIRPNKGLREKSTIQQSCSDCKEGVDPINCLVCGQEMVFCKRMRYYHSTEIRDRKCIFFDPK